MSSDEMCVLCFNSQWRSVVIGTVSVLLSLAVFLVTWAGHQDIRVHLRVLIEKHHCSSHLNGSDNRCVILALSALYPWPLWITLLIYVLVNMNLVISALYK